MTHSIINAYTDGGARGNPGPAAIGVVLTTHDGSVIREHGEYIGETTNNVAEYSALIKALSLADDTGAAEVHCHLDSELVVKQMKGEYKVRDARLQALFVKVWNAAHNFKKVTFTHIRRERNTAADALVNHVLDAHEKKSR